MLPQTLIILLLTSAIQPREITLQKRQICNNNSCNSPCDGRSCNTCNNNVCCSSVNCNQCVNECASSCSTAQCRNNCVTGCNTSCQQSNCAVSSCSSCVNKCSNNCSNQQCVNSCSRSCDCVEKENNDSVIVVPSQESSQVTVNNTNINNVNLTTHINIDNVIHNINNISIPIYVNTTNINNINLSDVHESTVSNSGGNSSNIGIHPILPPPPPVPFPIIIPQPQPQVDNCCYLLHPRQCYQDDDGRDRCYIRRSRECSSACTSPVVSIEQGGEERGCQRVNSWPYYYCGNYVRRDCSQCYSCGGGYNPGGCFRQTGCSESCRSAAPNCVPSHGGLQCY